MSAFILAASTTAIRPLYTSPSPGEPPEKSLLKPSTRPPAAPTARRSSPWPRASRAITSPGSVVVAPRAVASSSGLSTYPRSARARACNCRTIRATRLAAPPPNHDQAPERCPRQHPVTRPQARPAHRAHAVPRQAPQDERAAPGRTMAPSHASPQPPQPPRPAAGRRVWWCALSGRARDDGCVPNTSSSA